MAKNYYEITLAFVGICQTARLVQQVAYTNKYDEHAFQISLNSLFQINPQSTISVFGGATTGLQLGCKSAIAVLSTQQPRLTNELTTYIISMMALERKMFRDRQVMQKLSERLNQMERQLIYFSLSSDTILYALESIYLELISPLGPKIKVIGNQQMTQNRLIQAKIRALLLAGVRATVLWRQLKGNRWQILLMRRTLLKEIKKILAQRELEKNEMLNKTQVKE